MKKKQAADLNTIVSDLEGIQARLELIREQVSDAYEAMSEKRKESDAGSVMQEQTSQLADACSDLDSLLDHLGEALRDENE